MRKSLTMKLLKKEKIGNKRKITLFGFLKISYKKHNDEKHQKIIITDEGKNNSINGLNPLQYQVFGDGKIIIKGNNNQINIGEKHNFNNFHLEIWGDNSIIGMGSVVAGKFEKGVIIAGNPAKKIRENINWSK